MLRHSTPELNPNLRRKRGIGIMEVLVAALVLGLLYLAVSRLQSGNRDTLLRIRGRDGATEVAQNIIDEMSSRGLASFTEENLIENADGTWSLAKLGGDDIDGGVWITVKSLFTRPGRMVLDIKRQTQTLFFAISNAFTGIEFVYYNIFVYGK